MHIYKVIGNVTLSRSHPSFQGARLLATEPVGLASIGGAAPVDPTWLSSGTNWEQA